MRTTGARQPSGLAARVGGDAVHPVEASRASALGTRDAWLLTAATALVAAVLLAPIGTLPVFDPAVQVPALVLTAAFALVEVVATEGHVQGQTAKVSLADVPLVVGLFYVSPLLLVVTQLAGTGAGMLVRRRTGVAGFAFRLALLALTTCLTVLVFRGASALVPASLPWRLAAYAATTVGALVVALGFSAFDRLGGMGRGRTGLQVDLVIGGLVALFGTSVGLMLVVTMRGTFEWLLLLIAPAVVAVLGYRAVVVLTEREERLAFLHDCAGILERPFLDPRTQADLLERVRRAFDADLAELLLAPSTPDAPWTRSARGPGSTCVVLQPAEQSLVDGRLAHLGDGRNGGARIGPPRGRGLVARRPDVAALDDCLTVPLWADGAIVGTLTVAQRLERYESFGRGDLLLLEALGGHVGVAFRAARLIERLRGSLATAGRLAAIVESSDDAIIAMTPDRTITSWNDGAAQLFGYSADEAIGRSAMMLVPPERRDEVAHRLADVPALAPPRRQTSELLRVDGTRVLASSTVSPIVDQAGSLRGLSAIIRDETERARTDAALRESEERTREIETRLRRAIAAFTAVREPAGVMRAVLEAARDLLDARFAAIGVLADDGTRFVELHADGVDEAAGGRTLHLDAECGVLGYVGESTSAIRIDDVRAHASPDEFPAGHPPISSLLAVPIAYEGRLLARLFVGTKSSGQAFTEDDEVIATALAAQAAVALANADANARMLELVGELDRANADLRKASDAKSEFLATMSHELRTPLHSILVAAELVGNPIFGSLDDDRVRHLAGTIHGSGRHLLRLVDDLVDLSKIEAGRLELHPTELPLGQLLAEIEAEMAPLAREKGVALELPGGPGPLVSADPLRLRQVLLNLVANAVRFTDPGGRVWIETTVAGEAIAIGVHDTGIGIAAEDLDRVFEPFEQASGARSTGAGLGLAIARRLTELHGGRLEAISSPGEGSVFSLVLPVRPGAAAEAACPEPQSPSRSLAARRPASVLVVEDDRDALDLAAELLDQAGYEPIRAESLAQAIAALESRVPDLVLLDVRLPDGDGLELARRARAGTSTRAIPILALSAEALNGDVRRAVDAGCNAYLTKPISPRDLLARIAELLPGDAPPPP